MEWQISKGVRDAHIFEDGKVKLPKHSLEDWPTQSVYAAVHKAPEGNYVTCLPALPPTPYMTALFKEHKIEHDKQGNAIVDLGDLCNEANIQTRPVCITFSKLIPHPTWKTIAIELWDPASYMRHDKNAGQEYYPTEEKAKRALWRDPKTA